MKRILAHASRIILGIVFVYSGFVKVIDPLGTAYKFTDYFKAFGTEWLIDVSLPLAFLMCAAEFIFGLALLLNVKLKLNAWGVAVFMLIFTPITLWLAITNSVSDCGCFGDALTLTNWETFFKNLIIDVFVVILLLTMHSVKPLFGKTTEWIVLASFAVGTLAFEMYNYNHLPIIDFRPYSEGTNIPDKRDIPDNAPAAEYEMVFTLKDTLSGNVIEISSEKYMAEEEYWKEGTKWKYIDREDKLIKEGYKPPIHDFNIVTTEENQFHEMPTGTDVTDKILADSTYSMLMVAYNLNKANEEALKQANKIAQYFNQNNLGFYCLSASVSSDINHLKNELKLDYDFYTTDETTLKTVVRANPGFVLLKNGNIIKKWHYRDMPDVDELKEIMQTEL